MQDLTPILQRAARFFMGKSAVHEAARAIARVLEAEGISYYRGRFSHRRPRHADRAQAGIGHDGKFDELWELAKIEDDY